MSDPETPKEENTKKEAPKEETPEDKTGPVEGEKTDVPETAAGDKGEAPAEMKDAAPDNGAGQKRKNLLISIGLVIVIIAAAICAFAFFSGPVATNGDTVSVFYVEAFENGTVYQSNMNTTIPLVFTLGNSSTISGVQEAVTGMSVNQIKTVTLPYTEAYGAYDPGLIQTLNRTGPIANTTFVAGESYMVHYRATNSYSTVKVLNVTPKTITWDANNPLAGENLTFTIKLAGITRP
ncbi:MAG: FKBP-type peptidyl-prolyl cis-trans isomerase [Methanoregula sp.]|jgi:peptidylprolyl isomerase|uniref:FKBP-type peptidyl-prolyl cis-trans isomerase n=1 Tax=Methanoregula sp. TaxID=2052170 RepID=UPI003C21BB7A